MARRSESLPDGGFREKLVELLGNGYTDEVKAFTKSIQTNPDAVKGFEAVFNVLTYEAMIDWEGTPSQEASLDQVVAYHEGMMDFLSEMSRPFETYVMVSNHGHEVTFEMGWQDQAIGRVVWDRWTIDADDPVMAYADVAFLFDMADYCCQQKPAEKKEPPLYRYHPERFKAYRDYAEPLGKLYRQKVEPRSGLLTLDQVNELMRIIVPELNSRSMKFPRKHKDDYPPPGLVIDAEQSLSTAYGRFVQAGRQIMDFPPALTEMLAKTDVDDIPLDSIQMPYSSQYLYFGPQTELELEPGWLVDGAYVEYRGVSGDLRFTVTAVPVDHHASALWYLLPEAEYTQDFVGEFRSMDLATAMDTVLSSTLAGLQKRKATTGGNITNKVREQFGQEGEVLPENVTLVDISPTMATERLEIEGRRHPVYQAAIRLVVNALCYVAAYPDDIDTVWPAGTPDSLQQKVLHGKGKEQQRAKSKLAALGYVPVHICGKRIAEQRDRHNIPGAESGHVATHWRRGHWRNQVHGPGRSLRKLIWLMPVIVGSKDKEDPESGHIYLVS